MQMPHHLYGQAALRVHLGVQRHQRHLFQPPLSKHVPDDKPQVPPLHAAGVVLRPHQLLSLAPAPLQDLRKTSRLAGNIWWKVHTVMKLEDP